MKLLLLAGTALLLAGCADQKPVTPINPSVPYSNNLGPGAPLAPPLQQGSLPTR